MLFVVLSAPEVLAPFLYCTYVYIFLALSIRLPSLSSSISSCLNAQHEAPDGHALAEVLSPLTC